MEGRLEERPARVGGHQDVANENRPAARPQTFSTLPSRRPAPSLVELCIQRICDDNLKSVHSLDGLADHLAADITMRIANKGCGIRERMHGKPPHCRDCGRAYDRKGKCLQELLVVNA